MPDNILTKINIIAARVIGWFLFIGFGLSGIVGFFMGDFQIGLVSFGVAFFGYLLTRYKRKKKNNAVPISTKNHWEEEKTDSETPKTEIQKRIEFMAQNQRSIDDEPDIADTAMSAVIRQRKQPLSKEEGGEYRTTRGKPSNFEPLLELCDEIENIAENNYLPFEPPVPVEITYCDRDGEITSREIDIFYIAASDFSDDYYIKAFCHLRNEDRIFNIGRIQQTKADGNIVDIIQYLVDAYRNTDKYKKTILSIKTSDVLNSNDTIGYTARILTYISRIDGIFTRKEKTIIALFIEELDNNRHDIEIEDYIKELAKLDPPVSEYKRIVKAADISDRLIEKAKEITGKDPLRQGAFAILFKQYEKNKLKPPAL
jgi:hypothetical protein